MAIIRTMVVNMLYSDYDVDMTRRSRWGNPFRIGRDGTRKEVVAKHKDWLQEWHKNKKEIKYGKLSNKWVVQHLPELKGKRLGCVCFPLPCHVDNIVALFYKRFRNES